MQYNLQDYATLQDSFLTRTCNLCAWIVHACDSSHKNENNMRRTIHMDCAEMDTVYTHAI